jgi:phosphotriesterase-related protein
VQVMTVEGPVSAEGLGVVLTHEHLLLDMDWPGLWPDVSDRPDLVSQPVSMENLGAIRRNYMAVRDNARLDDVEVIAREVEFFKAAGGGAIVEQTPLGLGRRPELLPDLARRSGVRIIAATGIYLESALPPDARGLGIVELQRLLIRDLIDGFPGTDVRAGHIGEIALSSPLRPSEERALRAAARAQKESGASISVHIGMDPPLIEQAIAILVDEAADLERVAFDHVDSPASVDAYRPLLDRGIYASFDTFGHEFYCDNGAYDGPWPWYFPRDTERLAGALSIIEAGYGRQLLLSHDVCVKMQLRTYGGWGYGHVIEHVAPMLRRAGVSDATIATILVANPARFLAVPS